MAINYSATLYPRNDTTVDTGTGIDIRLLGSTAGSTDTTQSVTWTNAQDNIERTFDPATAAGATNTNNAGTTLFKMGYALRLSEDMTPGDDTNCDSILTAGTLSVNLETTITSAGGTLPSTADATITHRASLWQYKPSTDTGTLIAAGSQATTWTNAERGTYKTTTVSVVVGSVVTFAAGEVLLLQVGANSGTLGNPALGTQTYTFTFRLGSVTRIDWATNQGIRQVCTLTTSTSSAGVPTRNYGITPTVYTSVAAGHTTYSKLSTLAKSFALTAVAAASRTGLLVLALPRDLIATATPSYNRQAAAQRTANLTAQGAVISHNRALSIGRLATGIGIATYLKQVTASKSFTLNGVGTSTFSKFTIANREFTVVGQARIVMTGPNASMISMPLDDIPDGGVVAGPTYIFPVLD